jgi:hypothetical protein
MTSALREASKRFQRGELPHLQYDLTAFEPAHRVSQVIGFYSQVINARQESSVPHWETAVAT